MASSSPVAAALRDALDWWDEVNDSPLWQDRIFHALAALFGFISVVALIQLVRIECRVPEYGWTTQKVFHFLNFVVNAVRSLVFVFRRGVQRIRPEILQHVLLDMPGLLFFTTYALLVLFWAEIYYQARAVSTDGLRPSFYTINSVVYGIQIALWLFLWWKPVPLVLTLSKIFFAGVSLFAALGFLLYGGRLFLMLQRFPVESKGRRKKLQEVGYVTTICFTCFLIRCIMMFFNAFDKAADLDVLNHPVLNFLYFLKLQSMPVLEAELTAIRTVLSLFQQQRHVKDCKLLLRVLDDVCVSKTARQANLVAHQLAMYAKKLDNYLYVLYNPPDFICSVLQQDSL